jgi:hypothetical protein
MNQVANKTLEPTKRMDLDAEFPRNQSLSTSNQDREGVRDNAALSNRSKQRVSFADQPGIENEINNPIAASDSTHNLWHMPPPINLDSSGLRCSSRTEVMKRHGKVYSNTTTLMNQEAHLHSASPQSFKSALVLFSTICSFGYGLSCMAYSQQKKVTVTLTAKVSFSDYADAKINNALSFRHTASSTLQLVVASVDDKLSKGSTKINNASSFRHTASSTLQLVVASIDEKFSKGSTKSNNALPFSGKPSKSIDGKSASSTFQLVVALIWIVSPEGVQAPSNIQVYCCINFVTLIIIPNFKEASTLIVGYHYSKISLPFCKDCRMFCEGVRMMTMPSSSSDLGNTMTMLAMMKKRTTALSGKLASSASSASEALASLASLASSA